MKYPKVAENFIIALFDNKMTQQQLADRCGIGKASISHYVHGTHCPDNIRAIQIAEILHVNPLWLMGLSEIREPVDDSKMQEFQRLFASASDEVQQSVMTLLRASQPQSELREGQEEKDK